MRICSVGKFEVSEKMVRALDVVDKLVATYL